LLTGSGTTLRRKSTSHSPLSTLRLATCNCLTIRSTSGSRGSLRCHNPSGCVFSSRATVVRPLRLSKVALHVGRPRSIPGANSAYMKVPLLFLIFTQPKLVKTIKTSFEDLPVGAPKSSSYGLARGDGLSSLFTFHIVLTKSNAQNFSAINGCFQNQAQKPQRDERYYLGRPHSKPVHSGCQRASCRL